MRVGILVGLLLIPAASLLGQPPPNPNVIVIRPKAPDAVTPVVPYYPDKPGFITIRPRVPGSPTGTQLVASTSPAAPVAAPRVQPPGAGNEAPKEAPKDLPQDAPNDPKGEGKVLHEVWYATFLRGMKAGHYHVVVREYERDGKPYRYATKTQKLSVARFGQPAEMWGEDTTMETPAGQVLTTRMRQGLGRNQMLSLTGAVEGDKLKVTIEGLSKGEATVAFPDGVLGIAREATLFADRKPKPGDTFAYQWWEGRVNQVVTFDVTVKGLEDLVVYENRPATRALRVEVAMRPIGKFRVPPATIWVDAATFETLRMDADHPTLGGTLTVLRTTKEYALKPGAKRPELNEWQSIRLPAPVADIHAQAAVTYTFRLKEGAEAEKPFALDERQSVAPATAGAPTFALTVKAVRSPEAGPAPAAANPGPEFLSDSFFIDWDNDLVKSLARKAAGQLPANAPAWDRAKAVEVWVNRNMKSAEFSQAMSSCHETAKGLTGDCTEYSMLAAGMCRALGVPSRTAMGLVYAPDRQGKPMLAYHMWFEVYAEGRWLALDATLARGSVGPGHLKVTDASWHKEISVAPLLPVLELLGSSPVVTAVSVGK